MNKKIIKLYHTAMELGGTVYEVAGDAGLLSAYNFMKLHFSKKNVFRPEGVTAVTEAYVLSSDTNEEERVFLYLSDADPSESDKMLSETGQITNGRLVIDYDRLEGLAQKGYRCLYHRGHYGGAVERIKNAFGDNGRMLPFKMWDSEAAFVGNGLNHALLVTTKFETLFVMPDIHTVKMSIRVVRTEEIIREKYDCDFRIEKITLKDEKALKIQNTVIQDMVDQGWLTEDERIPGSYRKLPESYRRLYYQIAYIMVYFPEVYEEVWHSGQKNGEKEKKLSSGTMKADIGICIHYGETYALCKTSDGRIRRIPNLNSSPKKPFSLRYRFDGYGVFANTEAVIAEMAGVIKNVIHSAQLYDQVEIEKVYVTVAERLLKGDESEGYKSVEWENLPEEAAKQGVRPDILYVDYFSAAMAAYSGKAAVKNMQENDIALFYDFREEELLLALIRKTADHGYETLCADSMLFPEDYNFEEGELNRTGLKQAVWSDIKQLMMDAGLSELGISDKRSADRKAWEAMKNSCNRIRRQLKRCNSAKIVFDTGYLSVTEDYPLDRLQKCFAPVLKYNAGFLADFIKKSEVAMEDISVVLLAGEESEYPFVPEYLQKLTGAEVRRVNAPEAVGARGALIH